MTAEIEALIGVAEQSLDAAEVLLQRGHFRFSVSRSYYTILWAAAFACFIQASGCAGVRVVESSGVERSSGMGASLTLPAGSWEVDKVDPEHVIEFRARHTPAHIALMRIPSRKGESGAVALKRLFAHFPDKRQTERISRPLRCGSVADFAEYIVAVEGNELRVRAYVVRRESWTYELVTWGLDAGAADAVADSLTFTDGGR